MITTKRLHYICGEFITGNTDRLVANNTGQSDHGYPSGTTTDVNDHIANWLFYINADTECGSHWFVQKINFLCTCLFGAVANGTFFHLGYRGRNTYHHSPTWRE